MKVFILIEYFSVMPDVEEGNKKLTNVASNYSYGEKSLICAKVTFEKGLMQREIGKGTGPRFASRKRKATR